MVFYRVLLRVALFVFIGGVCVQQCNSFEYNDINVTEFKSDVTLSRHRRFIAFPVGSSFSVAVCMTVGTIGNPNVNYLSLGLNWGIAYELPNITWVLENLHGFPNKHLPTPEPVVKRRYRRDLYQKLELLMDGSPEHHLADTKTYFRKSYPSVSTIMIVKNSLFALQIVCRRNCLKSIQLATLC